MTSGIVYKVSRAFKSKLYDDGAVIYIIDQADTIQLDSISFCLLEKISTEKSTPLQLIEYLSNTSDKIINLSVEELFPYIEALISQNLIVACKH